MKSIENMKGFEPFGISCSRESGTSTSIASFAT